MDEFLIRTAKRAVQLVPTPPQQAAPSAPLPWSALADALANAGTPGSAWQHALHATSAVHWCGDVVYILQAAEALVQLSAQEPAAHQAPAQVVDSLPSALQAVHCAATQHIPQPWVCPACAISVSPYSRTCSSCGSARTTEAAIATRPLPSHVVDSPQATAIALLSACLPAADAVDIITARWVMGGLNPAPPTSLRAEHMDTSVIPYAVNCHAHGLRAAADLFLAVCKQVLASGSMPNLQPSPELLTLIQLSAQFLRLHLAHGIQACPIDTAGQLRSMAQQLRLAALQDGSPLAGCTSILQGLVTHVQAGAGLQPFAGVLSHLLREMQSGHVPERVANFASQYSALIPIALAHTAPEAIGQGVLAVLVSLMPVMYMEPGAQGPQERLRQRVAQAACTTISALLHDPAAMDGLQLDTCQHIVDALLLGAAASVSAGSFNGAAMVLGMVAGISRSSVPALSQAVVGSALLGHACLYCLRISLQGLDSQPLLHRDNIPAAKCAAGVLSLLTTLTFHSCPQATADAAVPPVRVARYMLLAPLWACVASACQCVPVLCYTPDVAAIVMEADPERVSSLSSISALELECVNARLGAVASLLRAPLGSYGPALDQLDLKQHPEQCRLDRATLDALAGGNERAAEGIRAIAVSTYSADLQLCVDVAAEDQLCIGLCSGQVVSTIADMALVAPAPEQGVWVHRHAKDAQASAAEGRSPCSPAALWQVPARTPRPSAWVPAVGEHDRLLTVKQSPYYHGPEPPPLPTFSKYASLGHVLVSTAMLVSTATTGLVAQVSAQHATAPNRRPSIAQCGNISGQFVSMPPNPRAPNSILGDAAGLHASDKLGAGNGVKSKRALPCATPTSLLRAVRCAVTWAPPVSDPVAAAVEQEPHGVARCYSDRLYSMRTHRIEDDSMVWQQLAPALAHPVDWIQVGELPSARPPVALFEPVPPAGYTAVGLFAVPMDGVAPADKHRPLPREHSARDAAAQGAALAAQFRHRKSGDSSPGGVDPSQIHYSTSNRLMSADRRDVARRSMAGQQVVSPPLDSAWCLRSDLAEVDRACRNTGIAAKLRPGMAAGRAASSSGAPRPAQLAEDDEFVDLGAVSPAALQSLSCFSRSFWHSASPAHCVRAGPHRLPNELVPSQAAAAARRVAQHVWRAIRALQADPARRAPTAHAQAQLYLVLADLAQRLDMRTAFGELAQVASASTVAVPTPMQPAAVHVVAATLEAIKAESYPSEPQRFDAIASLLGSTGSMAALVQDTLSGLHVWPGPSLVESALAIIAASVGSMLPPPAQAGPFHQMWAAIQDGTLVWPNNARARFLGAWLCAVCWRAGTRHLQLAGSALHGPVYQASRHMAHLLIMDARARQPGALAHDMAVKELLAAEAEAPYHQRADAGCSSGATCAVQ